MLSSLNRQKHKQNIACFPLCLKLPVSKIQLVSIWIWIPILNDTPGLVSFSKYISQKQIAETMMKGHPHALLTHEYLSWNQLSQNWKLDLNIEFGHKNWQAYILSLIILLLCFFLF